MTSPVQRCTYVQEVWGPHPGCREFMSGPEAIIQCSKPATHLVKSIGPLGPDREIMCAHHAILDLEYLRRSSFHRKPRAYRYRHVDNLTRTA